MKFKSKGKVKDEVRDESKAKGEMRSSSEGSFGNDQSQVKEIVIKRVPGAFAFFFRLPSVGRWSGGGQLRR